MQFTDTLCPFRKLFNTAILKLGDTKISNSVRFDGRGFSLPIISGLEISD